jgi:hypothetical protein
MAWPLAVLSFIAAAAAAAGPASAQEAPPQPGAGGGGAERTRAKTCPPPESFRAMQHLFDNPAPTLQAYPVVGDPPPEDLFRYFGKDMEPRCALERTFADLASFRAECDAARAIDPTRPFGMGDVLKLHRLSYRAFKRYQWCILLQHAKAPEFEYDGARVPELTDGRDTMFTNGLEAAKLFVTLVEAFVESFKGLEADAAEAIKRLEEDVKAAKEARKQKQQKKKPTKKLRSKKEIERDEKIVQACNERVRQLQAVVAGIEHGAVGYRLLGKIHGKAKYSWPAAGNPVPLLTPLAARLDHAGERIRKRLEKGGRLQ